MEAQVSTDIIETTYQATSEHYKKPEEVAHMLNAYVNFFNMSIESVVKAVENNAREMTKEKVSN